MKAVRYDIVIPAAMVAVLVALGLGIVWFMGYNEARSYAKFCDQPVTTWDAIFLDLRIDECQKCD